MEAADTLNLNDTPSCGKAVAVGCYMPDWLVRLELTFGDASVIQFIEAFGGKEVVIPRAHCIRGSAIERVSGPHVAEWLRKELGHGREQVPLGPLSISVKPKVLIFRALQSGLSNAEAATIAQCSRQTIIRRRRDFEAIGYLKPRKSAS